MKLSEHLIQIRNKYNLTQEELASELHVTRQAVSKWERDICYPDIEILKRISSLYKISLNVLLGTSNQAKSTSLHELAYKSTGGTLLLGFGLLFCLIISIIFILFKTEGVPMDKDTKVFGYSMIIVSVICTPLSIRELIVPRYPIKYNDYGLTLYFYKKREVFIPYEEILDVKAKATRARHASYTFGKIIFNTNNNRYVMRNISRVDDIKGRIIALKTKATISEIA